MPSYSPQNHQAKASSTNLSHRQLPIRHHFFPLRPCLLIWFVGAYSSSRDALLRFRREEGSINSKSKLSSSTFKIAMELISIAIKAPSQNESAEVVFSAVVLCSSSANASEHT
ncbi:hypothetical protein Bca4012_037196 [Brassica carinata]|uniref:Uncharacterized protein n=1 Tax=Brassica carinata TaxID=52824 RepID=A0A8X8BB50_BRACI|nr:hypothetical protein Bca52824_010890 [Brassica carinata]